MPATQAGAGAADASALLSVASAGALLRASGLPVTGVEVTYVRLKPGQSALVGYLVEGTGPNGEPVSVPGYVRVSTPARARELVSKWRRMRPTPSPLGEGVRLLDDDRSVLFLFPNDAALPGLRFASSMQKLKRILSQLEAVAPPGQNVRARGSFLTPVRYKPERRFIAGARLRIRGDTTAQAEERSVFLRFFPDARGATIARTAAALRGGRSPVPVPVPLGTAMEGRLFVEEAVVGEEIMPAVLVGRAEAPGIVEALRRLHGSHALLPARRSPRDLLASLEAGWGAIDWIHPGAAARVRPFIERLGRAVPTGVRCRPIHGDLHLHQMLTGPDGPVFVDLERAAMGDPLQDLGGLVAHLLVLGDERPDERAKVRAFQDEVTDSYLRHVPRRDREDLRFFVGAALLERALLPYRQGREDRKERGPGILALTSSVLAARPARPKPTAEAPRSPTRSPVFFSRPDPRVPRLPGYRWEVFYPRRAALWPGYAENPRGAKAYGVYDREMDEFRAVAFAEDPVLGSLASWFGRGDLVAYRVGRRATIRVEAEGHAPTRFVKLLAPRKARALADRTRVFERVARDAGEHFPVFATLLGAHVERGVLEFAGLPGVSLNDLLISGRFEDGGSAAVVGRALAALHSAPTPATGLPAISAPIELAE
ncbi:MAG: aminoglycoside phosphotransferase family protein, partial [Actinobacteria bacterium]|nr:aminoglycoside phosphotransferase family protein [Actinomycetota bacterium]